MIKKIKKYASAFICAALLLTPVFSQEFDFWSQETAPEQPPQELQQNFIIVEPVRVHELNPQITNSDCSSEICLFTKPKTASSLAESIR